MEGQCREKFRGAGRPSVSLTSPLREGTEWLKHTRGTEARDRVAQRAVDRVSSIHTFAQSCRAVYVQADLSFRNFPNCSSACDVLSINSLFI